MAHLVYEIGSQLPALREADHKRADQVAVRSRLFAARQLLEVARDSLAEFGEQRVQRNAGQISQQLRSRTRKVNLGSGRYPLAGWLNLDIERGALRQALQWGLPFPDGSVKYVFLAHVLEHFYFKQEALNVLREIHRVTMPDAVVRIIVPHTGKLLHAYARDDQKFFSWRRRVWVAERKCATPLEQVLAYVGASSPCHAFHSHKWGYDFQTLKLLLHEAGFRDVNECGFMKSRYRTLRVDTFSEAGSVTWNGEHPSLFVEAKP